MLMFYIVHDSRHLNHPIHTKVVLHFLGIMLKNLSPKRLLGGTQKYHILPTDFFCSKSGKVKDHGSGSMGKVMVSLFNLNHLPCKSYGLFLVLQKRGNVVQFYRCMLKDFSIMLFLYFGGKAVLALGLEIAQRRVFPIHIYAMVSALVPCFECL
ncbi:hypothetical protein CK203_075755 [Vitis vinifera]|uniref:Uncharacterized protein n=1 Tax=Vitis vinifera TaxID=29760 RepID=A0A438F6W1_VITVI|nr:hypothetical protein CK203_075755 [Vitis vinifera]